MPALYLRFHAYVAEGIDDVRRTHYAAAVAEKQWAVKAVKVSRRACCRAWIRVCPVTLAVSCFGKHSPCCWWAYRTKEEQDSSSGRGSALHELAFCQSFTHNLIWCGHLLIPPPLLRIKPGRSSAWTRHQCRSMHRSRIKSRFHR